MKRTREEERMKNCDAIIMEETKRSRTSILALTSERPGYKHHPCLNWGLYIRYSSWDISILNLYGFIIDEFTLNSSQFLVFFPKTPLEALHVRIRVFREWTSSHGPAYATSLGTVVRSLGESVSIVLRASQRTVCYLGTHPTLVH